MTAPVDVPLPPERAPYWYPHYEWMDASIRYVKAVAEGAAVIAGGAVTPAQLTAAVDPLAAAIGLSATAASVTTLAARVTVNEAAIGLSATAASVSSLTTRVTANETALATATNSVTNDSLVKRSSTGTIAGARFFATSVPATGSTELVAKAYADALGTSTSTGNSVVRRNANGDFSAGSIFAARQPTGVDELTRKDYVDFQLAALTSIAAAPPRIGKLAVVGTTAYIAVGTASTADWKQIT